MSYIQIQIGGKLRGLKFNMDALMIYKSTYDQNNIGDTFSYGLIYAGLLANVYVKTRSHDLIDIEGEGDEAKEIVRTFEDVCDWVDDLDEEVQVKVYNVFTESVAYQKKLLPKIKEAEEEENKKKGMITKPTALESDAVS